MSSHFQIGVLPSERPLDTSLLVVSAPLPGIDFTGEGVTVGQAPIQALAIKDANFDFRHVQPTGVLRGVVKDDATQQLVRHLDAEHVLETLAEMRVEVVQYQMNSTRRRVDLFEQVLDEGHEIRLGAMIGNLHGPSSAFGFDRHEQVACAAPYVLVIQSHGRSWLDRQGLARILEQLLALLVQANNRFSRPERTSVQVQQIDHLLLRVVRCLPIRAGVSGCAEADGQALEKPRGRKPRGEPGWLLQVIPLWGFEPLLAGRT